MHGHLEARTGWGGEEMVNPAILVFVVREWWKNKGVKDRDMGPFSILLSPLLLHRLLSPSILILIQQFCVSILSPFLHLRPPYITPGLLEMPRNALLSYNASFHLSILRRQGIKKMKNFGAFLSSGIFTGSFTLGKRHRFILEYCIYFTSLPTLILNELLEGRLCPSYVLSIVPRTGASRVDAHGTILVSQASLTHPGLRYLPNTVRQRTLYHKYNLFSFSHV